MKDILCVIEESPAFGKAKRATKITAKIIQTKYEKLASFTLPAIEAKKKVTHVP